MGTADKLFSCLDGLEMGKRQYEWLERRFENMTAKECLAFTAAVTMEPPSTVEEAIDIASQLDKFSLLYGAHDTASLGDYYMKYIETVPSDARPYLDPEKVGLTYRGTVTGCFCGGQFLRRDEEIVHSGEQDLDWLPTEGPYAVRVKLASRNNMDGVWVGFPDQGEMEVYNDFNSNLTNLFFCVKERTMALIRELGFLPLNARDDFNVLVKFFSQEEFTDEYLEEELELTERYLPPPKAKMIQKLMRRRSRRGDVRRAADYFKLVRYSFSGGGKSFAGKPCDLRQFFYLIWECARRLINVVVENRDFGRLIRQYDREDAFLYCDPPYYEAEGLYAVLFRLRDHLRLHEVLLRAKGYVMVSYNLCDFVLELYKEFYIFHTSRPNSMSQKKDSQYEEVVITNYDPRKIRKQLGFFNLPDGEGTYELIHEPERALKEIKEAKEYEIPL